MGCNEALFRDVILKQGVCDRIQLGRAAEKSKANGLSLAKNLSLLGILDGEQIAAAYAAMGGQAGLPEFYFCKNPERLDIDTIGAGSFSETEFSKYQFIPMLVKDEPVIFMVDPFDDATVDLIKAKYPLGYTTGVISDAKLEMILSTHYSTLNMLTNRGQTLQDRMEEIAETDTEIETRFLSIIRNAMRDRASDIHFVQSDIDATVTVRIDGDIHIVETTTKNIMSRYISKLREHTVVEDTNEKIPQTGKALIDFRDGTKANLRVSLIPGRFGTDANIRIITDAAIKVANLGFADDQLAAYQHLLSLSKGLILVVGPTGSGKSTTMYGGLSMIRQKKVMSVEDPVEYIVPGMLQVDVNEKNGISFLVALKAFMRHDPDVIVVGEIRDIEVANAAIVAANTGHLVISTLHTNSAVTAANRLITMGVDRYSICEELSAVMSQRLLKRICPNCRETYTIEEGNPWIERYGVKVGDEVARGAGCPNCRGTGYLGRIATTEILRVNKSIRNAIEKQMSTYEIEELAKKQGFVTMVDDAIVKAKQEITTFDEVDRLRFDLE